MGREPVEHCRPREKESAGAGARQGPSPRSIRAGTPGLPFLPRQAAMLGLSAAALVEELASLGDTGEVLAALLRGYATAMKVVRSEVGPRAVNVGASAAKLPMRAACPEGKREPSRPTFGRRIIFGSTGKNPRARRPRPAP